MRPLLTPTTISLLRSCPKAPHKSKLLSSKMYLGHDSYFFKSSGLLLVHLTAIFFHPDGRAPDQQKSVLLSLPKRRSKATHGGESGPALEKATEKAVVMLWPGNPPRSAPATHLQVLGLSRTDLAGCLALLSNDMQPQC